MNKKDLSIRLKELKHKYQPNLKECEACGSNKFALLQMRGRVAEAGKYGNNPILCCLKCSFKMQNPRYPDEFYEEYFEEIYREVCFGIVKPSDDYLKDQIYRGTKVNNYLKKYTKGNTKVLDHGSACGGTLMAFKDDGWDVYGVDPHKESVESGKKHLGFDIRLGVGEKLPFESNFFDLLISLGSTEHAYDLEKTLLEIKRVLTDEGLFLIRWRSDLLWGSPLEYYNHNHYRFFTDKTWDLILKRYGFEIIDKTNNELEEKPGEVYILAKKSKNDTSSEYKELLEDLEFNNECAKQIDLLNNHKKNYESTCIKFLAYCKSLDYNYDKIATTIRKGIHTSHRLLAGDNEWAVKRAIDESKKYLELLDKKLVY